MLTPEEHNRWARNGWFILRDFADEATTSAIIDETLAAVRSAPPDTNRQGGAYRAGEMIILLEGQPDLKNAAPEARISKVFNGHLAGAARAFGEDPRIGRIVSALLDDSAVDVFQSQYIFKNPGAWGQPWHQDSYYFQFDRQPQVGVWLALTDATLDNGCLAVLDGSHHEPLQRHDPDPRPGANYGYLEIFDHDFTGAKPVLMQRGDLLVFHSFLMHRSYDNQANTARMAMVYHYGRAGTRLLDSASAASRQIIHFRRTWTPGHPDA